ncbi:MAG TPA: hypothetical protein VNJ01_01035 [Bacteriovoracaceae bacterium]|nr:hypothetical protein [Bacteriovoracaceae bacterium]
MKLFLFSMLLTSSVFASTYNCGVKGFGDYAVEVNLKSKKAAFFDNDNWSVVKLTNSSVSTPVFSGKDNYGDALAIMFDLRESSYLAGVFGKVSFVANGRAVARNLINCKYEQNLNSGI